MFFEKKIFREYDIRGVFNKDYDPEFAGLLGKVLAYYIKNSLKTPHGARKKFKVSIGRDARHSGKTLFENLSASFLKEGFDVVNLEVVPTPLVYFSLYNIDIDAAVCITGSHNPAEYNGFKVCVGKDTLHGEQIQELLKLCNEFKNSKASSSDLGKMEKKDIVTPYIDEICKNISFGPNLKNINLAIDCGNGAACTVAPKLLEKMGFKAKVLFGELDGSFPNHHPDPTVIENLKDLISDIKTNHRSLGIAYDGDADRIGAVDNNGRPIYGDELLVLYSREILSRKPGATIISEVKSSTKLYEDIKAKGGNPIMWKTGHSLIKTKMKEVKAELAGEMSGHVFFSDRYYGYDDAIYASVRLLEILSKTNRSIADLLSDLPKTVSTPELRVDCDDEIKFKVVDDVCKILSKKYKVIDIDGVRVETDKGWGLLRASNTQPAVVMRFEAKNETDLAELRKLIEDEFKKAKNKYSAY